MSAGPSRVDGDEGLGEAHRFADLAHGRLVEATALSDFVDVLDGAFRGDVR